MRLELVDEAATQALGRRLAAGLQRGIVYLQGELGAGKTALARAILRGRGYPGKVRSPTYTLVEPYRIGAARVYHLDLYRLSDPEELEWIGIRDALDEAMICLIEWPQRGAGSLPTPDLVIGLEVMDSGRKLTIDAASKEGERVIAAIR